MQITTSLSKKTTLSEKTLLKQGYQTVVPKLFRNKKRFSI